MSSIRKRGEVIRAFLLEKVVDHPGDVAALTAAEFGISRQAVSRHLKRLVEEGVLTQKGNTRSRTYELVPLDHTTRAYPITDALAEDQVLREDVSPLLGSLPDNVAEIWDYGFTEMFNNAIDHSGGSRIAVSVEKTAATTKVVVQDDGIGIFAKIQTELGLIDERHAVLELAKGKLTTDPANHTGEGIFFSSRMFDRFAILSGGTYFSHHHGEKEDWILEQEKPQKGTAVFMDLNNHTSRTVRAVFGEYTGGEDYGFNQTVVPVRMARWGDENLVSRSQAKRLLARVGRFKTVLFDFEGVEDVGQAFADEIFRVFQNKYPETVVFPINANAAVTRMILRATDRKD